MVFNIPWCVSKKSVAGGRAARRWILSTAFERAVEEAVEEAVVSRAIIGAVDSGAGRN